MISRLFEKFSLGKLFRGKVATFRLRAYRIQIKRMEVPGRTKGDENNP